MFGKSHHINRLSFTGLVITLGIVYGDIGTSPLYVLRAIINGAGAITPEVIMGGISCIFWTLTLQTTFKYVIITLRADNKGEGGIFSLYALIRKKAKWVFIFAIIGGSTLLADGIITPAITVVSAIEGLGMINPDIPILPIVLIIITFLFLVQQFGTNFLGESFGPIMFVWFTMLGVLGLLQIFHFPAIIQSVNPVYAYKLLVNHPSGFLLLGAIFLCTTGAEALYSDLGHCGVHNIRASWTYVKTTLVFNYMGQGAWLLMHPNTDCSVINPFYSIMPSWFLMTGIVVATTAAVIASQALISGSYTIISEAILLNFWPKVKINYPTQIKGQMYIPSVNRFLWIACILVILFFRESSNMEAAYGLSITITMLMTTILLSFYFYYNKIPSFIIVFFILIYLFIEGSFLIANLNKFTHGGWVTIVIAGCIFSIMYIWYKGRSIKNRFISFTKIGNYLEWFKDLKVDETVSKYATNLVYLTRANYKQEIESKVIFSIFNKQPKRADLYWFIHIDVLDDPHTMDYKVDVLIPDTLIRVDFKLGFKVQPRVNLYFKQVINELVRNTEVDITSRYDSLRKHHVPGDFKFVIIDRIQNYDFDFLPFEQFIMDVYAVLKNIGITDTRAYGLDTSNVFVEKVPLQLDEDTPTKLRRIY
ncbi:MAG: KUP/HAK/KT family potassium transporter [Bacteroidetes bacterium]|nr:KUP/HAK/KT family potassium transporter [Bacteroidota bacterium]